MPECGQAPQGVRPLAVYIHDVRSRWGAEKAVLNIVSGLAQRGHTVDLLIEYPDAELSEILPKGVNIVELKPTSISEALLDIGTRLVSLFVNLTRRSKPDPFGKKSFQVAIARFLYKRKPPVYALRRYLKARRPQSIVAFLDYPSVALVLATQLGRDDIKVFVSMRNNLSSNVVNAKSKRMREMPVLLRNLFQFSDGIIAVSDGVANDIADLTDMPRDRVTRIYNPVIRPQILTLADKPPPHPWLQDNDPPVILGAGRMKPAKDFPMLLRAFARVREKRPVRLIIVGDGPGRQDLETLAKELGVWDDIDFPGYQKNPFAYYRHAAVFTLSSAWEGLPNVLIEALACGARVVSTDCPSGPAEILDGGRFGTLVPVGDDRAMAKAIEETLDQKKPIDSLKEYAQRFSFEHAITRYEEVLFVKTEQSK